MLLEHLRLERLIAPAKNISLSARKSRLFVLLRNLKNVKKGLATWQGCWSLDVTVLWLAKLDLIALIFTLILRPMVLPRCLFLTEIMLGRAPGVFLSHELDFTVDCDVKSNQTTLILWVCESFGYPIHCDPIHFSSVRMFVIFKIVVIVLNEIG